MIYTPPFNLALAKKLAALSKAAYPPGVPTIYNERTDTAVFFTQIAEGLAIGFPGTRNLRDLIVDAEAWRRPRQYAGNKYSVHSGIQGRFDSVADQIHERIADGPAQPIYCYGHSKGGMMAVMLAAELPHWNLEAEAVYTYGQPRFVDAKTARYFDQLFGNRHFWFEDEADLVPWLAGWLAGNRHSGNCMFFPDSGGLLQNPLLFTKLFSSAWELYKLKDLGPVAFDALLADHHMDKYLAKLDQLTIE